MAVDLSTPEKCVTHGSRVFTKAEKQLEEAWTTLGQLHGVFEAAGDLGMMGKLQTERMKASARVAQGLAAQLSEKLFALHREATDIAIANGVDQVTGVDGGVVTLGGGSR